MAVMGSVRRSPGAVGALVLACLLLTAGMGVRSPSRPDPPHGDGCDQSAYAVHGARQYHSFTWVVNTSSIPSYLDRAGALRAIRRGTATTDRARTACPNGRALAPVQPHAIYAGPTDREANVTPEALCFRPGNSDGINVVSFGRLPAYVVAVTCTYTDRGDIWQSDIMLSAEPGLFTLDPDDGHCVDSYDLQAVMTHERGHSFGLAHVPEGQGSDHLTMSSGLTRCDASAQTLGWGDVLGLAHIYGH
jgi:hypothetical protein